MLLVVCRIVLVCWVLVDVMVVVCWVFCDVMVLKIVSCLFCLRIVLLFSLDLGVEMVIVCF